MHLYSGSFPLDGDLASLFKNLHGQALNILENILPTVRELCLSYAE